jgi:hypothetical protein
MRLFAQFPRVALVVGLVGLGSYLVYGATCVGLWIDELYTLHAINLPWPDMLLDRLRRGHPPLYFLLEKIVWVLTGGAWLSVEFRLRLLSLVSWGVAVVAFFNLTRRLLTPSGSLLALAIFALGHISAPQAANGRMYALAIFFSVIHIASFLRIVRRDSEEPHRWWLIFLFSSIIGMCVTPSFALLICGTTSSFIAVKPLRSQDARLGACSLVIAGLFYVPAIYLYLITPHQLGPVTKHWSRVYLGIPALLTGIGRGKLPDDQWWQWAALLATIGVTGFVSWGLIWKWRGLAEWKRRLASVFLTPFLIFSLFFVLSLFPPLAWFRIGTDRYLAVFAPVGALLAAAVFEEVFHRHMMSILTAALIFGILITFPPIHKSEGQQFREEMLNLRKANLQGVPTILCPPEIVEGVNSYCPGLAVIATFGINARARESIATAVKDAVASNSALIIYYRGHVPEVLEAFRAGFTSHTLISKRHYGSKRDPIFALFLFTGPRVH